MPRFQIASDTATLPAPPPLSAGQYAICNCDPVQVGSPAVTIGAEGDGVGGGVGEAADGGVGAIDGVMGDWVFDGALEGVRAGDELVHDTSVAVMALATSRQQRAIRCEAPEKERRSGSDIVDLITLALRVQFRPRRCQNVPMTTNPPIRAAIATAAPDTGQTQALGRRIGGIVAAATESKAAVITRAMPMVRSPIKPKT